jgi:hypothetical protein
MRRSVGSPGRYSIRPDCNLPVGASPNNLLGSSRGVVLFDHYVCGWIRRILNTALPATVLGGYPQTQGWLHIVDVVFGLAPLPIARRSCSAAVRVACSRFI